MRLRNGLSRDCLPCIGGLGKTMHCSQIHKYIIWGIAKKSCVPSHVTANVMYRIKFNVF